MALDVRGKTVVLTGTFSRLKRADAEKQLVALGAKIGGSVGKATHILFAGEKAGSKINAATRLGVKVLGEDALMAVLVGDAQAPAVAGGSGFAAIDPSLPGPALMAVIEALVWDDFEADRDLPPLRAALYAHETAHGITVAHRAATARLRPHALLGHAHGHDVEIGWSDLSPDGRFLATGSWIGDDYERGGVLQIWDVRAGRCVNMLRISGGVGWPDYDGCVQWRPDGRRIGLAFDTNGVGSFDPFAKTGEPDSCAYVTDGWSRPPGWTWAPNSRDVYIACWGPKLALGAIVALVGRRPEPRWCAPAPRVDDEDADSDPRMEPMKVIDWSHPDRIVGYNSHGQLFALAASGGALLWEGTAHPPVSFAPDGSELAMHPAGIVYYDATTGLPNGKLPMHVGAQSLVYTRDGSRLAALVQPGNPYGAEAGVFIYDRGDYRYSPDVPPLAEGGHYAIAWHPGGRRAVITGAGRVQIWELGETPRKVLDIVGEGDPMYGDGVLVTHTGFGLVFRRDTDGAVIGQFEPAVEATGESPLVTETGDHGEAWAWNPAFPIDRARVAVALPEGLVIGPASVAEVDGKIAWVIDRKWAWPWRWGEAKVWPDAAAASADKTLPVSLKRKLPKVTKAGKATTATKPSWPPPGGTLDDIAELLETGVKAITDGYHGADYRRKFAVRTMAHGMFERAAAAIDATGWDAWSDAWFSALTRGETVVTALAGRAAGVPAPSDAQCKVLRRWLREAEALLKKKEARERPLCRPRAMVGAGWILLGEAVRGEVLLAEAIAGIDPENNTTEHRRTVADALSAIGRRREAAEHLTSSAEKPSWTETPGAFAAMARHASAEDLQSWLQRLQARGAHNEFAVVTRGLARLAELRAWDVATAWLGEFNGLSMRSATFELATAMAAAGEAERAEAVLAAGLTSEDPSCAEFLLTLARCLPERAGRHLARIFAAAPKLAGHDDEDFYHHLAGAAARLGQLEVAAKIEALASSPSLAQAARVGVLTELDPAHPQWGAWFARTRDAAPRSRQGRTQLAALAFRGGLHDESAALLDEAIERTREASSPDISMMEVMSAMTAVDDLAGAHRAWMAISKGKRSHRNDPLLTACAARGLWAAALEILRQMPQDLNGSPQRASKMLLTAAGQEGW